MIKMTVEAAFEDLNEIAQTLVTKAEAAGADRAEAIAVVAQASVRLANRLKSQTDAAFNEKLTK